MFICGYHFPASEGNDIAFDKVIEKVETGAGETAGKKVSLTGETAKGEVLVETEVPEGTFAHKAFIDYFNKVEMEGETKMVYYTNKYQISEISKSVDGEATKELCKNLDDMNLYRVTVA
ncbi:MAG TPA: hypothetical protein ENK94_03035 [Campylobacterales bacterium]|nr:hypothetical protein [Campylobacterales bacterium]